MVILIGRRFRRCKKGQIESMMVQYSLERQEASYRTQLRQVRQPHHRSWWLAASMTAAFLTWLAFHWFIAPELFLHPFVPQIVRELISLLELAAAITLLLFWALLLGQYLRRPKPTGAFSVIAVEDLYSLSPKAFEHYVATLFRHKGYRVTVSGRSGDEGVDLEIIQPNGKRAIAQCKRYRNTVGPEIVRELYGTLIHERVLHAFLVTTAPISEGAREWARHKPITLIDGETLVRLITALARREKSVSSGGSQFR
jgi:restriction system protein